MFNGCNQNSASLTPFDFTSCKSTLKVSRTWTWFLNEFVGSTHLVSYVLAYIWSWFIYRFVGFIQLVSRMLACVYWWGSWSEYIEFGSLDRCALGSLIVLLYLSSILARTLVLSKSMEWDVALTCYTKSTRKTKVHEIPCQVYDQIYFGHCDRRIIMGKV